MGLVAAQQPRAPRATIAALVLVVALLVEMVASLAFPAAIPRLVVLPQPAAEVTVDRCGLVRTPYSYEREAVFWVRRARFVTLQACL